jgi:hypothetical protein
MLNAQMRLYDYYTIGDANEYGQPQVTPEPVGQIKMAINITSQSNQSNINYKNAQYVGLTKAPVDDKYIIKYNGAKLKVLYCNTLGRYTTVFMSEM